MSKERIRELEKLITYHKSKYYQGCAEISDEAYDKLEDELKKLDPKNPILDLIGTSIDDSVEKIIHQKKMLSLEKTYSVDDITKFLETGELVSVFKIDGSSCSLVYRDGYLEMAKTRGDGSQGENITRKVAYIGDVPKKINSKEMIEVRGEIFCRSNSFHSLSEEMTSLKLEKPRSQRNIVAGILGRKEHLGLSKHLSFQAFDVLGKKYKNEVEKLKDLAIMGFDVPEFQVHKGKESIHARINETKDFMTDGDYLIDGLVFVLNDQKLHEELGETSHHPRYKLAFKFQGESKDTVIEEITWQVSRNGRLTPVAEVRPIELSGAMISRVTLHNMGVVKDFDLKPGDTIEIIRSGEVIPKFLSVKKSISGKCALPKKCPSCDQALSHEDIWLMCTNESCPGKKLEGILHWIKQVNIEDLSEKRLQEMIARDFVADIPDLYRITVMDLLTFDKVKDKLAHKIFDNIQKTKRIQLATFMSGLGIEGVSITKAEKIIANGYNTIEKLLALSVENLVNVEGFAVKSATDIVKSIQNKKKTINELIKLGFEIELPEVIENGAFNSKKICITGALSRPRAEIEKLIKLHGGVVVGSVSKNTDYLLTNETDPSSSKFKKAAEIGTPVITEEQFLKLIEG